MAASYGSRNLPMGVAILAVLIGIVGALLLIAALILLIFTGIVVAHGFAIFGGGLLGALLLLVFAIVLLAVASGLWHLELWALVLSIIVVGLLFVGYLLSGSLLGTLFSFLVLVYLFVVNRHFR